MSHLAEWKDLIAGLSLLYLGPDGAVDDLTKRAMRAMERDDEPEMEHITALLIGQIIARGRTLPEFARDRWNRLSMDYHTHRCPEVWLPRERRPVTPADPDPDPPAHRRAEMVRHLLQEPYIFAPTDFGKLADLIMAHEDYARREAFLAMQEGARRVLRQYEGGRPSVEGELVLLSEPAERTAVENRPMDLPRFP